MPPCPCSVRALELFVKDFGGIRIRQTPPPILLNHRRGFGTRHSLRQLETSSVTGPIDDAIIPFVLNGKKDNVSVKSQRSIKKGTVRQREPQELDEEWHAEIEIAEPWPLETNATRNPESTTSDNYVETSSQTGQDEISPEVKADVSSVDDVSFHNLHHTPAHPAVADSTPLLPLGLTSATSNSKVQSRLERKRRRIEAGEFAKYKKLAQERQEEAAPTNATQSVLEQIEALDGPGLTNQKEEREKKAVPKTREAGHRKKQRTMPTGKQHEMRFRGSEPRRDTKQDKISSPRKVKKIGFKDDSTERSKPQTKAKKESWQVQKAALQHKFGEDSWTPRKRLSPDTLEGIRALHASNPAAYPTKTLAEHFEITPEAIRRVLKSKWKPNSEEIEERRKRWERRGVKKWTEMSEQGVRPPAKWRAMGIKHKQPGERKKKPRKRNEDGFVEWDGGKDARSGRSFAGRIL